MTGASRLPAQGRKQRLWRISAGAGCCLLLFSTSSTTHGESIRRVMSVSATVVDTCRVALGSAPRNARPPAGAPPQPQLDVRCGSHLTKYEVVSQSPLSLRAREEDVRPCPGCAPTTYTTIVF